MDQLIYKTLLFDFYGELLTYKQKYVFELYYLENYSLSEIALEEKISPQGVYESIKKSELKLINFEKKLGLIKKYSEQKENIKNIIEILKSEKIKKENLTKIKNNLNSLI